MTAPIGVVGAGRMGEGIALTFLAAGHPVVLADVKDRTAEERRAYRESVRAHLARRLHDLGVDGAALDGLTIGDRTTLLDDVEVVFEAVPEVLDVKREVLAWLSGRISPTAVVASTTSTFVVTEVAPLVDGPHRVVNAHWLNPAELMPLVEISRSDVTDPAAVAWLAELLRGIGKVPVVCGPAPGYIVPRLQSLVMNEAARMVEEGVADAAAIDLAVRAGLGPRFSVLGPLEFIDWGGGDILYYASRYLAQQLGDRFRHPAVVEENMAAGRRGLRDGVGFYAFDPAAVAEYQVARIRELDALLRLRAPELCGGTPVPTLPDDAPPDLPDDASTPPAGTPRPTAPGGTPSPG